MLTINPKRGSEKINPKVEIFNGPSLTGSFAEFKGNFIDLFGNTKYVFNGKIPVIRILFGPGSDKGHPAFKSYSGVYRDDTGRSWTPRNSDLEEVFINYYKSILKPCFRRIYNNYNVDIFIKVCDSWSNGTVSSELKDSVCTLLIQKRYIQ